MNQCHATIEQLSNAGFKAATQAQKQPSKTLSLIYKKHGVIYDFKHVKGLEREISKYGINHRTRFNFTPLMMVTTKVNLPQIHALAEMGADNTLWANNGLNAWQMYLGAYLQQQTPSPQEISQLHPLLAPSSVSIQVDGKLEKLDEHSMYGFLLNVFISLWYDYLPNQLVKPLKRVHGSGFKRNAGHNTRQCLIANEEKNKPTSVVTYPATSVQKKVSTIKNSSTALNAVTMC